jgi:hypothetical protein
VLTHGWEWEQQQQQQQQKGPKGLKGRVIHTTGRQAGRQGDSRGRGNEQGKSSKRKKSV